VIDRITDDIGTGLQEDVSFIFFLLDLGGFNDATEPRAFLAAQKTIRIYFDMETLYG
jgi:hypothetical protein